MSHMIFIQGDSELQIEPLDDDLELPVTATCDGSIFTIYLKTFEARELAKFIMDQLEKNGL